MTTKPTSTSPFQNSAADLTPTSQENFSFRTMQDDIIGAKKNDTFSTTEKSAGSAEKEQSSTAQQIKPAIENKSVFPPKENLSTKPNPFLDQVVEPAAPKKEEPISEKTILPAASIVEIPQTPTEAPRAGALTYRFVLSIIILLVTGIIGLGGYYFWLTRTPQQTPAVTEDIVEATAPILTEAPVEKYSAEKPNYLVLSLENLSATEIQKSLLATVEELKNLPTQLPYEFVVVDTNNNPISFPVFATAAGLKFSANFISAIGNDFSLFIYNDSGNVRLGLSTAISNKETLAKELSAQEKTLSGDLSFLFLGVTPDIATGEFKDGSYDIYKTRYLNLNAQGTLSIDYVLTDNKFIIGTSKETLRAIINKQVTAAIQPQVTEDIISSNINNPTTTETVPGQEVPTLSE